MIVLSRPARSERLLRVVARVAGASGGGRAVIWAAVLAALLGAGVWLIARALAPSPRPLRALADELVAPRVAGARGRAGTGLRRWWRSLAVRLGAGTSPRLSADLAVLRA